METTLTQAVERQALDLERFLELWPLLTSKALLQALEAAAGRTVSLFVAAPDGGPRIEILVDHDAGRAAVDDGGSCCWGAFAETGEGATIAIDAKGGGSWQLAARSRGAALRRVPV